MGDKKKKKKSVEVTDENVFSSFDDYEPSVTWAVFLYWILPVLVIACTSRFLVDPHAASGIGLANEPQDPPRRQREPLVQKPPTTLPTTAPSATTTTPTATTPTMQPTPERPKKKSSPVPTLVAEKPSSYIEAVQAIGRRRLDWDETDSSAMGAYASSTTTENNNKEAPKATTASSKPKPSERPVRGASSDPVRNQLLAKIDELRDIHEVRFLEFRLFVVVVFFDCLVVWSVTNRNGSDRTVFWLMHVSFAKCSFHPFFARKQIYIVRRRIRRMFTNVSIWQMLCDYTTFSITMEVPLRKKP